MHKTQIWIYKLVFLFWNAQFYVPDIGDDKALRS